MNLYETPIVRKGNGPKPHLICLRCNDPILGEGVALVEELPKEKGRPGKGFWGYLCKEHRS